MSRFALFVCAAPLFAAATEPSLHQAQSAFAQVPLRFEGNPGPSPVRYTARAGGYSLLLTAKGASLAIPGSPRIDLSFLKSNDAPRIEALEPTATRTNYFVGRRDQWRTAVPSFSRVRYHGVYPGIDVVYYGNQSRMEYDFVLDPGADPNAIRLRFQGARNVRLNDAGDLVVDTGNSQFVQKRPVVYQEDAAHTRSEVSGRYTLLGRNTVGVKLNAYDRSRALVIDPVLFYVSYLGGSGLDQINAAKIGPNGMLYIAGQTDTAAIPVTDSTYQNNSNGLVDAFVAILDTTPGHNFSILYMTYLGGGNNDIATGIDVDSANLIYVTGRTASTDFPTRSGFQNTIPGQFNQAFVSIFDLTNSGTDALVFSTFLGGTTGDSNGAGISVDSRGIVYVIGSTKATDFPVTGNAIGTVLWGPQDAFIAQINPNGGLLTYASYLGGESSEDGRVVLAGQNGICYFALSTLSQSFPTHGFFYNGSPNGTEDIVIGVIDTNQAGDQSLPYSTYFGGSGIEEVRGMAFDAAGNLVLTGYTLSTDFPVTADALQPINGGNGDAFAVVFNPAKPFAAGLIYSTYLGGGHGDVGYGIQGDKDGYLYVTGYTLSSDFIATGDVPQISWGGGTDLFLIKFKPGIAGRNAAQYSTYLGGSGTYVPSTLVLGKDGAVYVMGYAGIGLPSSDASLQNGFAGGTADGFVAVFK